MPAIEMFVRELPLECPGRPGIEGFSCATRLEQMLYKSAGMLGFESVRYTCWHKDVGSGDIFHMSFSINFSNFPKSWEKIYEARHYYMHDPVLKAIEISESDQFAAGTWQSAWLQAENGKLRCDLNRVQELSSEAIRYGIRSGFYMMQMTGVSKFVISLGSGREPEEIERQVSNHLYQKVFALMVLLSQTMSLTNNCSACSKPLRVQGKSSIRLTPKQSRVLEAFAKNSIATNVDVARINHVTTETIAFHLKAIRKKFNTPSASGHALSNIAKLHGLI